MAFNHTKNRVLDQYLHSLVAQGNHLAYLKIKKRYEQYSRILCKQVLAKNQGSGVSFMDLFLVCTGCFKDVLVRYDPQQVPFYTFWLRVTTQAINDYLMENSYYARAKTFYGVINLDDENEERKINLEMIRENDEDYIQEKTRREIAKIIDSHKDSFTRKEFFLLHYVLAGYSIQELEHGEIMSRSSLYATFSNACKKAKAIVNAEKIH